MGGSSFSGVIFIGALMVPYGYQGIILSVGIRAVLAIGGHVAWAAAEGAALAICEKPGGFDLSQLKEPSFLIVTVICVVLHGIWDMYVPVLDDIAIPIFLSLKLVILIVAFLAVARICACAAKFFDKQVRYLCIKAHKPGSVMIRVCVVSNISSSSKRRDTTIRCATLNYSCAFQIIFHKLAQVIGAPHT